MAKRRAAFWACSVCSVAEAVHGLGDAFLETELACRLPEPLRSLDLGRRLRGCLLQPVDLTVDVAEDAPRDDADHTEEQDDRETDGDDATHPALKELDERREQDGADARGREERKRVPRVGQHVPDSEREHHDEQQRDDAGEGDGDA